MLGGNYMNINGFYLMPHPPIVIPEVGKGEELKISETSKSMDAIGKQISEKKPKTIIIVTPHGTMFQDAVALAYEDSVHGDLSNFRAPAVSMNLSINKQLTNKIYERAMEEDIPVIMATKELLSKFNASLAIDHGTMVPLYFVNKYYRDYRLIHITYAPLSDIELYKLGKVIAKAAEETDENIVFIASGDLSHRLKEDGPYDFSPFGEKFDKGFLEHLKNGDVVGAFNMDKETVCSAGECGRRSVLVMLGALEGLKFSGELLSYEGTFGVGYGVMRFNVTGENASALKELEDIRNKSYAKKLNQSDSYVKLARESLTTYLKSGEELEDIPDYVTDEMKNTRRGVFVSLKKNGELRGCIGTILPTTNSIAEEIIRNAVEAGVNDPRFYSLEEVELPDLDISVDVLYEPEPTTRDQLDPKEYGVIVRSRGKSGLLLPNLEGVDSIEEQLSIALRKAGIKESEDYAIERFKVVRHVEE
jgi:AmmeMemoRadiSam system protein A/AmmeMemoRadiSam system protein B